MGEVISVAIQSGGSAKTTTSVNLAYALQSFGKKVLLIDMDFQSNASMNLGFEDVDSLDATIHEVLLGEIDITDAIYETAFNIDLVPANASLSGFFVTAFTNPKKYPKPFEILKNSIAKVKNDYTHIILDTPPELGLYTVSGLTASDKILIPIQCEPKSIRGLQILLDALEDVKKVYNPSIEILGIVGTQFNRNTNISTTTLQEVRKKYSDKIKIFDTVIYRTVKFSEADLFHKPALSYSENEMVKEYFNLAKEVFGDAI